MKPDFLQLYHNESVWNKQHRLIAGVDEAGRGPIAGPVVIAAVILNQTNPIAGINDSKQLSPRRRELLFDEIINSALAYSIIEVSHSRIDAINILQAVLEGMQQAVEKLSLQPDLCLIDGNHLPPQLNIRAQACIRGDSTFASIAAASILAKVHRDRLMTRYDQAYPQYGFAQHKGYPTAMHLKALYQYGPSPIHRMSYAPVRQLELNLS
jgi:ribonuclease HII